MDRLATFDFLTFSPLKSLYWIVDVWANVGPDWSCTQESIVRIVSIGTIANIACIVSTVIMISIVSMVSMVYLTIPKTCERDRNSCA